MKTQWGMQNLNPQQFFTMFRQYYLVSYQLSISACYAMLAAGHFLLLLSFRSFFRRLISEVAWPIVTKLRHMFDGERDL